MRCIVPEANPIAPSKPVADAPVASKPVADASFAKVLAKGFRSKLKGSPNAQAGLDSTISTVSTASSPDGRDCTHKVGERIRFINCGNIYTGTLKFQGETHFAEGVWAGIALDEPSGKNNGTVKDVSYFVCPDQHGIFVRPKAILFDDETEDKEELYARRRSQFPDAAKGKQRLSNFDFSQAVEHADGDARTDAMAHEIHELREQIQHERELTERHKEEVLEARRDLEAQQSQTQDLKAQLVREKELWASETGELSNEAACVRAQLNAERLAYNAEVEDVSRKAAASSEAEHAAMAELKACEASEIQKASTAMMDLVRANEELHAFKSESNDDKNSVNKDMQELKAELVQAKLGEADQAAVANKEADLASQEQALAMEAARKAVEYGAQKDQEVKTVEDRVAAARRELADVRASLDVEVAGNKAHEAEMVGLKAELQMCQEQVLSHQRMNQQALDTHQRAMELNSQTLVRYEAEAEKQSVQAKSMSKLLDCLEAKTKEHEADAVQESEALEAVSAEAEQIHQAKVLAQRGEEEALQRLEVVQEEAATGDAQQCFAEFRLLGLEDQLDEMGQELQESEDALRQNEEKLKETLRDCRLAHIQRLGALMMRTSCDRDDSLVERAFRSWSREAASQQAAKWQIKHMADVKSAQAEFRDAVDAERAKHLGEAHAAEEELVKWRQMCLEYEQSAAEFSNEASECSQLPAVEEELASFQERVLAQERELAASAEESSELASEAEKASAFGEAEVTALKKTQSELSTLDDSMHSAADEVQALAFEFHTRLEASELTIRRLEMSEAKQRFQKAVTATKVAEAFKSMTRPSRPSLQSTGTASEGVTNDLGPGDSVSARSSICSQQIAATCQHWQSLTAQRNAQRLKSRRAARQTIVHTEQNAQSLLEEQQ